MIKNLKFFVVALLIVPCMFLFNGCGRDLGTQLSQDAVGEILAPDSVQMLALQDFANGWAGLQMSGSANVSMRSSVDGQKMSIKANGSINGKMIFGDNPESLVNLSGTLSGLSNLGLDIANGTYGMSMYSDGSTSYTQNTIAGQKSYEIGGSGGLDSSVSSVGGIIANILSSDSADLIQSISKKSYGNGSYDLNFIPNVPELLNAVVNIVGSNNESAGDEVAGDESTTVTAESGPDLSDILSILDAMNFDFVITVSFNADNVVTKIAISASASLSVTQNKDSMSASLSLNLTVKEFTGSISEPSWINSTNFPQPV